MENPINFNKKLESNEDMLAILRGYTEDQIARNIYQITSGTKAYVGKPELGIFQKLPATLEHVFISFSDNRYIEIPREIVEVGGKSAEQLISEMEAAGIKISTGAKAMLLDKNDFIPSSQAEEMTLIRLTVKDLFLGSKIYATTTEIFKRAEELGLELCPPDTGPNYCLKYEEHFPKGSLYIGMKPITLMYGDSVFELTRYHENENLFLQDSLAESTSRWHWSQEFVFRLRNPEA